MVIKCMKIEKLNCKMCKEIKFNGKIAKKKWYNLHYDSYDS